ncbi:hypothetical protein KY311_04835, partial [Candidatus Woesearchaeota archaeon]|nr:hypothetical protein [Candidatus Woesearchaeota archaeon]
MNERLRRAIRGAYVLGATTVLAGMYAGWWGTPKPSSETHTEPSRIEEDGRDSLKAEDHGHVQKPELRLEPSARARNERTGKVYAFVKREPAAEKGKEKIKVYRFFYNDKLDKEYQIFKKRNPNLSLEDFLVEVA